MTTLILATVLALVIHLIKAEIVKSMPRRLKTLVGKQGLVRGYLIYCLER